jgi:hypothetical protein
MSWIIRTAIAGSLTLTGSLIFANLPAAAQTCTPLQVVEGKGATTVDKKISVPAAPLPAGQQTRNNWNTDFIVEGRARKYVAKITPKNEGKYRIALYLKYPDNTADKVYDKTVVLKKGKLFTISGIPRTSLTPYQLNLFVGGVEVVGNSYTATTLACSP